MIDIQDFNYVPTAEEISDFVGNQLVNDFFTKMEQECKARCKIEFSKCSWEYGWNVKFKKSRKSLCTVYPRENYFTVLVVVGNKEKEEVENILQGLSPQIQEIYHQTKEGNGQRWLMIDLEDGDEVYRDALRLIKIRLTSK